MAKTIDLSIIIVNFNTLKLVKEVVSSIELNTNKITYEIIIVDNASSEANTKKELTKTFGSKNNLKLIFCESNGGFAKGNNEGIKVSEGKYILLLNSDTLIESNLLDEMVNWMDNNLKNGIVTCRLSNEDGTTQGTGGYFPTLSNITTWMFFLDDMPFVNRFIKPYHLSNEKSPFPKAIEAITSEEELDWVTGAFFLFRKEVVKQVGYLDDDYFMYGEDMDYCYRTKKKGWKIKYLPKWKIIHYGGKSSTKDFPIISEFKAVKLFYKKHRPSWQIGIVSTLFKLGSLLRILVLGIIEGKATAKIYVKAFNQI